MSPLPSPPPMMECGHAANGLSEQDGALVPACAICYGRTPKAFTVAAEAPDLTGREAKCTCGRTVPSSLHAAFFGHQPERETDTFYCGHAGWD